MKPRVILHNAVSADGRVDWCMPDIGLYYELAARWNEDATLAGCDTLLHPMEEIPREDNTAFDPVASREGDTRPILVVPDSRGRLRTWHYWKQQPFWKRFVSLCSETTPPAHLEYLRKRNIEILTAGTNHIDFAAALEELNRRYGVQTIRTDSGGTLNGVLLRAGLVDEVSLLIHPTLVGGTSPKSAFRADDLKTAEGVIRLKATHVETLRDDVVWLVYEVEKSIKA
jgi:2,5-diamino-6-(ribosylamino)-4(3H)-pyrimidinone 5'-phosphate reductase